MYNPTFNRRLAAAIRSYSARPGRNPAREVADATAILATSVLGQKARKAAYAAPKISNKQSLVPTLANLASAKSSLRNVPAPVTLGSTIRQKGPNIRSVRGTTNGGQRVIHRELINSALVSSSSFTVNNTYPVQPGMATTFPWLSTIAKQYEKYRIHSLKFLYVPFVASSTAGTVMMMADYNPQDPTPTTETQFMDHPWATSCSIWEPLQFVLSPKDLHSFSKELFVRSSAVAGDIKTFDAANFYFATDNGGTPATCGKLYVEYDIELLVPQLGPATYLTPTGTTQFLKTSGQTVTKNVATALTFAAATYNPLNIAIATSNTFTPPVGNYRVAVHDVFTDDTAETNIVTLTMYLNGNPYPTSSTRAQATTTTAGGYMDLGFEQVIPFNGTDTLQIIVQGNGAGGVLSSANAELLFSLA